MTGKELLGLIEESLLGDYGPLDNYCQFEGEGPPPKWKDWPMTYLAYGMERDGCVNEQGPFGDLAHLEQNIIGQAHAIFGTLRDAAVKEVGRKDSWEIQIWTEASYEDTSQTLVIDDKYGIVLCHYPCKAWQMKWDTPAEMAEELELLYQQIVTNLRRAPAMGAATELLAALKELYRILLEDEHYRPYNPKMKQARAAIAKVEGGVPSVT